MNWRMLLGSLAGFTSWWILFYAFAFIYASAWPAFRQAGRPAMEAGDFSQLSTAMLSLLIAMYFVINPFAGWLGVYIGRSKSCAWFIAAPLFLYAAFQHFYFLWNNLPDWYNLAVPLLIPPLVVLGGYWAKPPNAKT